MPTTFSIARELLARVEDAANGKVLLNSANVAIPDHHRNNAIAYANLLGANIYNTLP